MKDETVSRAAGPLRGEREIAEVIQAAWRDVAESDRIENELDILWANDKCLEISVAAVHAARAILSHGIAYSPEQVERMAACAVENAHLACERRRSAEFVHRILAAAGRT